MLLHKRCMLQHQTILNELLARAEQAVDLDGSKGFDALISIQQYARLYDTVIKYLTPQKTVLDWGSGSGHFSYFLSKQKHQVTAYGFKYPQLIKPEIETQTVNYIEAAPNTPSALPFNDKQFDATFSIGVLEHVTEVGGDEKLSLMELSRVLKDQGLFICFHLPNSGSWIEFLARRFGSYHHVNTYTKRDIHALFEPQFNILYIKRYAALPRNMLRRLPTSLSNNTLFIRIYDCIDACLASALPYFCQNWLLVAKKKHSDPS
jgi:ubiquinone/menaquinone biosynthesis C-methylase UbiE